RSRLIVGGLDRNRMMKQLAQTPHIVIGTPGRMLDMVKEGVLSIYHANSFVIDEADLMLELGFLETMDELLVRSKKDIQTLVFSATIPAALQIFFKKYLLQPVYIKIEQIAPESLTHHLIAINHQDVTSK